MARVLIRKYRNIIFKLAEKFQGRNLLENCYRGDLLRRSSFNLTKNATIFRRASKS
jgi:hypothetical protein